MIARDGHPWASVQAWMSPAGIYTCMYTRGQLMQYERSAADNPEAPSFGYVNTKENSKNAYSVVEAVQAQIANDSAVRITSCLFLELVTGAHLLPPLDPICIFDIDVSQSDKAPPGPSIVFEWSQNSHHKQCWHDLHCVQ